MQAYLVKLLNHLSKHYTELLLSKLIDLLIKLCTESVTKASNLRKQVYWTYRVIVFVKYTEYRFNDKQIVS